ncbi:MAG: type II toxin-antitoxin system VapC family toxin [Candidatus Aminicenantes bacterium]|nr:type II toxin-antitoxin system VapC family toxin [Candidatus Aminicenantes bacterium]
MKAFLDTSSLLKLYHSESGSECLHEIISTDIESIYLSEIAKIEFLSAIWKKIRQRDLTVEVGNAVISCFEADFNKFQWIKLRSDVIRCASSLLKKYGSEGLRTLDSMQLACAVQLKEEECSFFTSDKLLQKLFNKENLNIINYNGD